ncbi:SPOR domain-containing protein [Ancylomarina sp. DW003]|nr:SPOR domain-containing protein [Ancylomarina sp. DW003]MDE5420983.1 SPOR domain-containing protein [Ancylomarina sp. DW003]
MGSQENSQIRIKALLKELDRQQLEVKKKKSLIRVIVGAIILTSLVIFSFVYKDTGSAVSKTIQVEREGGEIVKEEKLLPKNVKTFLLVFKDKNQYPLARFFSENEASLFQNDLKKLQLPNTIIQIDTLGGKERVVEISSNYRYYIQFGIFKNRILSDLPDNMIYLHQLKDKNLYKYRLGPFAKSSQAKNLVKDLKLKDYLIVEVAK